MEKRLPFALFLVFAIWFGWFALFPPERRAETTPRDPTVDEVAGPRHGPVAPVTDPGAPAVEEADAWSQWLELGTRGEPGHYWARFDNRGAELLDLRLGGFFVRRGLDDVEKADRDNMTPLCVAVESSPGHVDGSFALRTTSSSAGLTTRPLEDVRWKHEVLEAEDGSTVGVRFHHTTAKGVTFAKEIRTVPGRHELALTLGIENTDPALAGRAGFALTPARGVPQESGDSFYTAPTAVIGYLKGDDLKFDQKKPDRRGKTRTGPFPPQGDISWVGVQNKYFAALFRGEGERNRDTLKAARWRLGWDVAWVAENPQDADEGWRHVESEVDLQLVVPDVGDKASYEYRLFAGPKQEQILVDHHAEHEILIEEDRGFFASIAGLLLWILRGFEGIVGNWGVAIILLTLVVRVVLFPFNRRMQTSMGRHQTKMKRIQPLIDEVKKKYENNPQKQREEQMKIMQKEGAFPPLGGCLPVFLQIPIFIGLFAALRTNFDLRQAPFVGWIQDLSKPDHFMRIDVSLPLFGTIEWLNVLPPAMVVLWILQQKVMPKPTDPQALKMQKMMMFMPILFGFFLYNYAAGLSLYMITTSFFGILEVTIIKKIWPLDLTEQVKKKSGFMARLAELQEEAQKMQKMKKQQSPTRGRPGGKGKGKRK